MRVFVRVAGVPRLTAKGRTARVSINGHLFTARIPAGLQQGDALPMRIRSIGKTIILVPETQSTPKPNLSLFTRLGLPQNPVTETLVSLFQTMEVKIDPAQVIRLSNLAEQFSPEEKTAAFMAGIIEEKGIPADEQRITSLLDALHSNPNPQESTEHTDDDNDILQFLNHRKTAQGHWIIVPFKKKLNTTLWKGFAAFLLDLSKTSLHHCTVRARSTQAAWIFSVQQHQCHFEKTTGSISPSDQNRLTQLLNKQFEELNLTIRAKYGLQEFSPPAVGIDISV